MKLRISVSKLGLILQMVPENGQWAPKFEFSLRVCQFRNSRLFPSIEFHGASWRTMGSHGIPWGGPWDPMGGPWTHGPMGTHWPLGTHWPMDPGPWARAIGYWLLAGRLAGRRPTPGNDGENDELGDTSRPLGQRAQGSHKPCGAAPPPLTLI